MQHALSRCLSLTALFPTDPISVPGKFINHAALVAGISPCYLQSLWGCSTPLPRGLKPPLTNMKLLLFSWGLNAPASGRENLPCPAALGGWANQHLTQQLVLRNLNLTTAVLYIEAPMWRKCRVFTSRTAMCLFSQVYHTWLGTVSTSRPQETWGRDKHGTRMGLFSGESLWRSGLERAAQNCSPMHLTRAGYRKSEGNSPTASQRRRVKHITAVKTSASLMRNYLLWLLPLYYYCSLFLTCQHAIGPVPPSHSDRRPTDNGQGWRSLLRG